MAEVRLLRRQRELGQNLFTSPSRINTTLLLIKDGWAFLIFKFDIISQLKKDILGHYIEEEINTCARTWEAISNTFLC